MANFYDVPVQALEISKRIQYNIFATSFSQCLLMYSWTRVSFEDFFFEIVTAQPVVLLISICVRLQTHQTQTITWAFRHLWTIYSSIPKVKVCARHNHKTPPDQVSTTCYHTTNTTLIDLRFKYMSEGVYKALWNKFQKYT